MKRLIAVFVLAVLMLGCLCSCNLINNSVAEEGDVTIVIENVDGSYDVYDIVLESVENKNEGVKGILEHLNKGDDKLYVEMVDSTYGAYVSAIGNIKEDAASGSYVMLYTSIASDSYEGAPTVDYDGTTLYQSGVGMSSMNVESGTVVLFRLETYSY